MTTETITKPPAPIEQAADVVQQLGNYGFIIIDCLYLIIAGMVTIFVLHKLASVFLYPYIKNNRLIKVIFGTLYVLVLAITALLALRELGFEVQVIGQLTLIIILIGAVIVFFLVPFLPRLPFVLGHTVDINGTMGTVDAISTFHTTIRKFDGTMVFVPNALVMASKISNYTDTATRRVELTLNVTPDSDLDHLKARLINLIEDHNHVMQEPAPPSVYITDAQADRVTLAVYCWVANEHWLRARDELWQTVIQAVIDDPALSMSIPRHRVEMAN